MSNLSSCPNCRRMENTYHALQDCVENWEEAMSESELEYRRKILKFVVNFAMAIIEDNLNLDYEEA